MGRNVPLGKRGKLGAMVQWIVPRGTLCNWLMVLRIHTCGTVSVRHHPVQMHRASASKGVCMFTIKKRGASEIVTEVQC